MMPVAVCEAALLFGTRVAETILASGHVRPHQQAGHMIASDPIKNLPTSCRQGAVHIWLILTVRDAIPRAHALATAEFNTIRLRLLKLGARVVEMACRIRLAFAAACPDAALIRHIATSLMPAGP